MATLVAACCCLLVALVGAFNLDVRHALVLSDPAGQISSYFGFSLALRKNSSTHTLVVGAPRANSSQSQHRGIHQPGVVYQCGLDSAAGPCRQLVMDLGGDRTEPSRYLRHARDDSWLGAALAVTDSGDRVVACAPRWRNSFDTLSHYRMNGACYTLRSDAARPSTLLPLSDPNSQITPVNAYNYFFYIFGQVGMAAHFPRNSSELVLGAPGVYVWRGTVVRVRAPYGQIDVPNALRARVDAYSYVGYSLSSGRFLSDSKDPVYVTGAPRGEGSRGQVLLFNFPRHNTNYLNILAQLQGSHLGEYFGAALCVADLNGDGLDDLVVGAPLYSVTGDEGRIYIYLNNDGVLTENKKLVGSGRNGARFGTALANAGDLNMDGKDDIAVGAPYEDRGVVYIYHGSEMGVVKEPAQVIRAEDVDQHLRGLGIALSGGIDVDSNGVPDLAAGAARSGHAVLLRGRPIVTLNAGLKASVGSLQRDAFNFTVDACLDYVGTRVPDVVTITMMLEVDPVLRRAELAGGGVNRTQSVQLRRGTPSCKYMQVHNRGAAIRVDPLLLVLHFALAPAPTDKFCATCPILDPRSPHNVTRRVAFESGCAGEVCRPDLRVTASLDAGKELVLGERPTLTLRVVVHNAGEPAYLARVTLQLPTATPLQQIPSTCIEVPGRGAEGTYVVFCDVGNPLNSTHELNLLLDSRGVASHTHNLTFRANASSDGDDVNSKDNIMALFLAVRVRAQMTVSGMAREGSVLYRRADGSIRRDVVLHHVYRVWNRGPSSVQQATLTLRIPKTSLRVLPPQASPRLNCVPDGDLEFEEREDAAGGVAGDAGVLELDDKPGTPPPSRSKRATESAADPQLHSCSDAGASCVSLTCVGGPFPPDGAPAVVTLSLRPILETLGDSTVVITRADLTVQIPPIAGGDAGAEVSTTLLGKLPEGRASSWIILVAVACGILILLLIMTALHKLGFFRRRQKEQLEALKENDADVNFHSEVVSSELQPEDGMQNPTFEEDLTEEQGQELQQIGLEHKT